MVGGGGYNAFSFLRHRGFTLLETVSDLERELGFLKWPHEVISLSVVKGTTRVLYRSPFGSPRLSIAQTVGKDTRYVRETEMIVEREDGSGILIFMLTIVVEKLRQNRCLKLVLVRM